MLTTSRVFLCALFLGVLVSLFVFARGAEWYDDSQLYIDISKHLVDTTDSYNPYFVENPKQFPLLTSPATLYIAAWLSALSIPVYAGITIVNVLTYLASIYVMYLLATLVLPQRAYAGVAALLFATNFFLIMNGPNAILTDMGGWLFFIAASYYAVRFFLTTEKKYAYTAGLVSMVGLFFKESGGMGLITLGVLVLASGYPFREKVCILVKSSSFLLLNLAYHYYIYLVYGYSYLNRYMNVLVEEVQQRNIENFVKGMGSLLFIGWIPVLFGIYYIIKYREDTTLLIPSKKQTVYILIALGAASLSFLMYPSFAVRLYVIALPLLCILGALGLASIRRPSVVVAFILVYIAVNIKMQWFLNLI